LEIHNDKAGSAQDEEEEVEYCPPKQADIPYESDILPRDIPTFNTMKPEQMLRGYYHYYFNQVDDNGVSRPEREMEEQRKRALERLDEQVQKDMDEFDWTVGDVPETQNFFKKMDSDDPGSGIGTGKTGRPLLRRPPTIAARNAASALSMSQSSSAALQGKSSKPLAMTTKASSYLLPVRKPATRPAVTRNSSTERATAVAASRSTLGYSKGRSTSSVIRAPVNPSQPAARVFARSTSTASTGSDSTITPDRYAQSLAANNEASEPWRKLEFLSIFDADEDDGNLAGSSPPLFDEPEDDFHLDVEFK
jgi:hypothetical protein